MFSLQTPDQAPKDFLDILLIPLLLVAITVVMWAGQNARLKAKGTRSRFWWTFFIPAALGTWLGFRNVYWLLADPVYGADVQSGRMLVTHWATFLMPSITVGLLYLWGWLSRKERSF